MLDQFVYLLDFSDVEVEFYLLEVILVLLEGLELFSLRSVRIENNCVLCSQRNSFELAKNAFGEVELWSFRRL